MIFQQRYEQSQNNITRYSAYEPWGYLSHFIINYVLDHLWWHKPFSTDGILVWVWTNEVQSWQPSYLLDGYMFRRRNFFMACLEEDNDNIWCHFFLFILLIAGDSYLHISGKFVFIISVHLHKECIAFVFHSKLQECEKGKNIWYCCWFRKHLFLNLDENSNQWYPSLIFLIIEMIGTSFVRSWYWWLLKTLDI